MEEQTPHRPEIFVAHTEEAGFDVKPPGPITLRGRELLTSLQQRYFDTVPNSLETSIAVVNWAPRIYPEVDPRTAQSRVHVNLKHIPDAFRRIYWELTFVNRTTEGLPIPKQYWKFPIEPGDKLNLKPAAITLDRFDPRQMPTPPKKPPFEPPVFRTDTNTDQVFKFDWIEGTQPLTNGEFAILARLIAGILPTISYYVDKGTVDEPPHQSIRAILNTPTPPDSQIRSESEMYVLVLNKASVAITEARNSGQAVKFQDPNMQRIWQYFLTRTTHSRLLGEISEKFGPRITF